MTCGEALKGEGVHCVPASVRIYLVALNVCGGQTVGLGDQYHYFMFSRGVFHLGVGRVADVVEEGIALSVCV